MKDLKVYLLLPSLRTGGLEVLVGSTVCMVLEGAAVAGVSHAPGASLISSRAISPL